MPPGDRPAGPRGYLTASERANMPKVTYALVKRILSYLKPYWARFLLVFVTILASAALGLMPSIITGRIVDEALIGRDMELLTRLILLALVTLGASQVIGMLENYINIWISQRIVFDMRNEMYAHLQSMPYAFFTTERQGDIITRMNSDINGISTVISGTLANLLGSVATVAATLVALFSMGWQLALAGIFVLPLLILPTYTVGRTRWQLTGKTQAKQDALNEHVSETLSASGSLLVKLFSREKDAYSRFRQVSRDVMQLTMREQRSGKWFRVILELCMQFGPLLIYFAGGYLIISNVDPTLTVGAITATVALVNRLYRPVRTLIDVQVDLTRSLALFTRIFDYLDRNNTIEEPAKPKRPDVTMGDIAFDDVSFAYSPGGAMVLDHLSFSIPGGTMYAIVGPSGSGKSTIVNLIARIYDVCEGSIRIAGVDVREFALEHLRNSIGMVTQDTYLFNGTIAENLRFAKPAATDAELEAACRIANIHDFIAAEPEGYATRVGNRGLKLSGGEKQRISIARVILKDPRILILDEATSSLDSISENYIQDTLEALMQDRTSIVIAHRLSTVLAADRILVVDHGRIVEAGSHAELLAQGRLYRELYDTQFKKALEYENNSVGI